MGDVNGVSADGSVMIGNTPVVDGEADSFRIVGSAIQPIGDLPGGVHMGCRGYLLTARSSLAAGTP